MIKIIKLWVRLHWVHLLAWALFILYETIIVGIAFDIWAHPMNYILHYVINILFFYFNAKVAMPWGLRGKSQRFYLFPLIVLIEITAFIYFSYICDYFLIKANFIKDETNFALERHYVFRVLYRCIYFFFISAAYYFLVKFFKTKEEAERAEKERLLSLIEHEKMKQKLSSAHNSFLKAQINPHFLFNTLDFIYHHVKEHSKEAGDAIISLSEMMRYAIESDKGNDFIIMKNEIKQVEKLLGIYQLRKNYELNVEVYFDEEVYEISFIPLILMTLVENIFKHGNLSDPNHRALIAVYVENDYLLIRTENLINNSPQIPPSNFGLKNISERLHFAYRQDVDFSYHQAENNYFKVKLSIPLEVINNFNASVVTNSI